MKLEKLLRDFSLRLIAFLVILIVLWSSVLLVGVSFSWSFLTSEIEGAFYLGGFVVGLLIFALSFTNITSSLTIISKAQNKEEQESKGIKKQIGFMLLISLGLIGLVIGGLWFAEWKVYQKVSESAWQNVRVISEKKQFSTLANTIKENGKLEDIITIRDALVYDVGSEGKISFLIPKEKAGVKIYYEITPWLGKYSEIKGNLSDADLNKFEPSEKEKEKFDQMINGKIDSFKVPTGGHNLRVFYSTKVNDQEIIILFDTSRQLKDSRGSFR